MSSFASARQRYWIYVVEESDPNADESALKIGVATNPDYRLAGMQCGNPRPLHIVSRIPVRDRSIALSVERRVHLRLTRYRIRGEWFRLDQASAIKVIAEVVKEIS